MVYSDLNVLRDADDEPDLDADMDDYSFDSFDTGQTLHAASEGDKAIKLLLDTERVGEISYAPGNL